MSIPPEKALSANLKWLMANRPGLGSQPKVAAQAHIDQRTVGRILNCEHSPSVDKVVALAKVFRVYAWQMLAPGLGRDLYVLTPDKRLVQVQDAGPDPATVDEPAAELDVDEELAAIWRSLDPNGRRAIIRQARAMLPVDAPVKL